ncbi:MAG: sulfatase-like hydrolase/transferase [Actinomycetota bacterium]
MPPDLVVLLCDTARADAFSPWGGAHRTPTMERLARHGIAYRRATAPAPWTLPSITSILSGRLPSEHGVSNDSVEWVDGRPASPERFVKALSAPWLPEELRRRGYRTWAASCNTWISRWGGFDRGFDDFVDLQDRTRLPKGRVGKFLRKGARMAGRVDHGGRQASQQFRRRLAEAGAEPLFAFVNLMEVHSPFNPPGRYYPYPPWRRAKTLRLSGASKGDRPFLMYSLGVSEPPPGYARIMRTMYYSCARYEDDLLGAFVRAIEDRGRPTVVVVVSDHGENLGEYGLFGHNTSLAETLLHVPLAVWGSGVEVGSGWVEHPVSLLGLQDHLLAFADGDAGAMLPNHEAVESEYESTTRWIPPDVQELIESRRIPVPGLAYNAGLAVRSERYKYVTREDGHEALYDVEDDPKEEGDLSAARPGVLERFRPFRDRWVERRAVRPRHGAGQVADEEIADHLRELGYID